MRPSVFGYLVLGLGLLLAAAPVFAHHSFMKEFDMRKPVTVTGVVTKIEWSNPHINFFIDVKDGAGKVTPWGVLSASPTALASEGWTRDSIKVGDRITVDGFLARDGKPFAATRTVTLADGRTMQANSDGVPPPPRTPRTAQ